MTVTTPFYHKCLEVGHLESEEKGPAGPTGSLWIRNELFLHSLGERAHGRGQWDSTTTGPTPVLSPLGIALWSIRHAVGGRSRSKRYSTGQISDLLFEICHLQSHRACSLDWIRADLDISFGLGY